MDKFLERQKLQTPTQEEIENMNSPIATEQVKFVTTILTHTHTHTPWPLCLPGSGSALSAAGKDPRLIQPCPQETLCWRRRGAGGRETSEEGVPGVGGKWQVSLTDGPALC